jgi:peptide deformylase
VTSLISLTDERLYNKSIKVGNPKSLSIKILRDKLVKVMKQENGIGIAANQIGRSEAMFIMYKDNKIITCINPSISWSSDDKVNITERCLSFPKTEITLARPSKIIAEYTNFKGDRVIEKMSGIEARCYQHELDHLSGITFIHRKDEQVQ